MTCPYCNRDMRLGYLHNVSQPIDWIPEGEKPSVWKISHAPKGVPLAGDTGSYWTGHRIPAHHCPHCKIVMAKTE